jgi:hypothetical protein
MSWNEATILSIDRSSFPVTGPRKDHNWLTTDDVQRRGTWDFCETRAGSRGTYQSRRIDGAHRAVRVCLRHQGAIQCTNIWYADNDDNAGDLS